MGEASTFRTACGPIRLVRSILFRTLCFAAAALPLAAIAQPRYAWELWGSELRVETDAFSSSTASIGASYYFDRVEDGSEPYALSEFFDPTTRLSATGSHPSAGANPFDPDTWSLSGRYLLPGSVWYVGSQYSRDDFSRFDAEGDGYGLSLGRYLGPRTTLELAVDKANFQYVQDTWLCPPPTCDARRVEFTTETDITSLSFVHVRDFRGLTYTLSGRLSQEQGHTVWTDTTSVPNVDIADSTGERFHRYSLETALYPTQKLGVHLGYQTISAEGYDGGYSLGAHWFFRRNVAFELSLLREERDAPPDFDTVDTRAFRITGRF